MYIIGDIHGCFLTLKKLVEKIGKDKVFYSVGDIVDKGPDTCKTLDFVISLKNFKMVLGNHEVQFINHIKRYINNEDISNTNWYKNFGGKQSIDSYNYLNNREEIIKKMKKHLKFLEKQEFYFYFKNPIGKINRKILISHGFALPYFKKRLKIKNDSLTQKQFTCNRLNSKYFNIFDIKNLQELETYNVINIFGHVANEEPLKSNILIDVDTSCVYKNKLTAYSLNDDKFISVNCIDKINYKEPE